MSSIMGYKGRAPEFELLQAEASTVRQVLPEEPEKNGMYYVSTKIQA